MTHRQAMDKLRELGVEVEGPIAYNEGLVGYLCGQALEGGADPAVVTEIRDALTADVALRKAAGRVEFEQWMLGEDEGGS